MTNPERVDLFSAPHKALRYLLSNLLVTLGGASFDDPKDVTAVTTQLAMTLWAMDDHIAHEDRHLRGALTLSAPNTVTTIDDEHLEHKNEVAELRAIAKALVDAETPLARVALGRTLYLHFSVFVAEALAHMAYEERVVGPLLEKFYPQEELVAIHERIVASIAPPDMFTWLRAMIPASNREERAKLLGNVQSNAPAEVVDGLLAAVRPALCAEDWVDLTVRMRRVA